MWWWCRRVTKITWNDVLTKTPEEIKKLKKQGARDDIEEEWNLRDRITGDKLVGKFSLSDLGYLDADTRAEVIFQTNLGKLVVGRKLGRGGFGEAYKATLNNKAVAVKKLLPFYLN